MVSVWCGCSHPNCFDEGKRRGTETCEIVGYVEKPAVDPDPTPIVGRHLYNLPEVAKCFELFGTSRKARIVHERVKECRDYALEFRYALVNHAKWDAEAFPKDEERIKPGLRLGISIDHQTDDQYERIEKVAACLRKLDLEVAWNEASLGQNVDIEIYVGIDPYSNESAPVSSEPVTRERRVRVGNDRQRTVLLLGAIAKEEPSIQRVEVLRADGEECVTFVGQLMALFEGTGWQVSSTVMSSPQALPRGVVLVQAMPRIVGRIVDSLKHVGVDVVGQPTDDSSTILMMVGYRL